MMKRDNGFLDGPTTGHERAPRPIEPGSAPQEAYPSTRDRGLSKNHAELVFIFGLLSLFMCGPLGVVAWILGNSDLKKIRHGEMSSERLGILRLGRGLGIIGTVIFVLSIALAAFLFQRGAATLGDILKTEPLAPEQIAFAGEWTGNRGTIVIIRTDGSADFKTRRSSMTGGRVKIQGDSLTIGLFGLTNTWRINRRPYLEGSEWRMILDEEVFRRKAEGQLARRVGLWLLPRSGGGECGGGRNQGSSVA